MMTSVKAMLKSANKKELTMLNEVIKLTQGDLSNVQARPGVNHLLKKLGYTSKKICDAVSSPEDFNSNELETLVTEFIVVTDMFYEKCILNIDSVFDLENMDSLKKVILDEFKGSWGGDILETSTPHKKYNINRR